MPEYEEIILAGRKATEMEPLADIPSSHLVLTAHPTTGEWGRIPYSDFISIINLSSKGYAAPTFDPGTPTTAESWQGEPGETYTYFLDENGDPIEIPLMDGDDYVIVPTLNWNGTYWVAAWGKANLTNYPTFPDIGALTSISIFNDESIFPIAVDVSGSTVSVDNPAGGTTIKVLAGQLQDGSYVFAFKHLALDRVKISNKIIHFTVTMGHVDDYLAVPVGKLRIYQGSDGFTDFSSTSTVVDDTTIKYDIDYTVADDEEYFAFYIQATGDYTPPVDTIFDILSCSYFIKENSFPSITDTVDRLLSKKGNISCDLYQYGFLTEVFNGAVFLSQTKIKIPTGSTGSVSYFATKVNDTVVDFPSIWQKKETQVLIEFLVESTGGAGTALNFMQILANKDSGLITDYTRDRVNENRYNIYAYFIPDESDFSTTFRPYLQVGFGGVSQTSDFFIEVLALNISLVPTVENNGFKKDNLTVQAISEMNVAEAQSVISDGVISGGLVNLINTTAFVTLAGNDATAEFNNAYKPFRTAEAAYDAFIAGGNTGVVQVGDGRFDAVPYSKYRTGIELRGNGKPRTDMVITVNGYGDISVVSPTRLVGGTIFEGQISVPSDVEHVTFKNFGIDCGSFVNNNQEGLVMGQYYNLTPGDPLANDPDGIHRLQTSTRPRMGVVVKDLTVLLKTAPQAAHCILIENAVNPIVRDCSTYFGQAGIVLKTIGGTVSGCDGHGHGSYAMIAKGNQYSHGLGITINNFTCESIQPYDGAGLSIVTETENLSCNISNGTFIGTKNDLTKSENGAGVVGVISNMLSINPQSSNLEYFAANNTIYLKTFNVLVMNY